VPLCVQRWSAVTVSLKVCNLMVTLKALLAVSAWAAPPRPDKIASNKTALPETSLPANI
jgi:hypothetical protein